MLKNAREEMYKSKREALNYKPATHKQKEAQSIPKTEYQYYLLVAII